MSVVFSFPGDAALFILKGTLMFRSYDVRKPEIRGERFCDSYSKHYIEIHVGIWNRWGFLSVLVVVLGGVIIIFSR